VGQAGAGILQSSFIISAGQPLPASPDEADKYYHSADKKQGANPIRYQFGDIGYT